MVRWIYAEPIDTLFFRDGKPFERGTENTAFSVFPPSPGTLYGALRTLIIMANSNLADYVGDTSLTSAIGDSSSLGKLKLLGPFLAQKTPEDYFLLFPIPKDLLYDKESQRVIKISPVYTKPKLSVQFNNPLELSLPEISDNGDFLKGDEIEGFLRSDYFLSYYLLAKYQSLSSPFERIEKETDVYFYTENKVGIKLDKTTNTSELHYLFSLPHTRLEKDIGFVFGVLDDDGKMPNNGKFRLGGETRLVRFETADNLQKTITEFNKMSKQILENRKQIKFVLLTPAIFEKGWIPDFLDDQSFEGFLPGTKIKLKLISCVLGKSEYIGGFDLAKGYPKEMKRVVPMGSVYFFEILENASNNLDELIEKYNFNSIERNSDILKQGFGQIIIGGW